jgi:copper chaperone
METTLIIEGMTCGGCEKSVRNAILQTPGIARVALDRSKNEAHVVFEAAQADPARHEATLKEIIRNVEAAGFDCRLA